MGQNYKTNPIVIILYKQQYKELAYILRLAGHKKTNPIFTVNVTIVNAPSPLLTSGFAAGRVRA
jgi:hypothetical protein